MQASLPSFVDAVRISDIGQGTNHLRVLSIRGLPDKPGDKKLVALINWAASPRRSLNSS